MKQIFSLILCTLLALSSLSAYHLTPEEPLPEDLQAWSEGNKQLTTHFYQFAKEKGKNLLFSPLSLQLGLAMTGELAYGKTQQEILLTTFLPEDHALRRSGALKLLKNIAEATSAKAETPRLFLANSAWVSSAIDVPAGLNGILLPNYHAEIHQADFSHFPDLICEEINTWVEDMTIGKIQNLLPSGSITDQTSLVLINTIYMKAPWAKPFDPNMTYDGSFYGLDEAVHTLPFMRQTGNYAVLDEGTQLVLQIPFKKSSGPDLSFFIVMPKEGSSLEELENDLTEQKLNLWISNVEFESIHLSMPKVKVSSILNAKNILQEMGMERPFSSEAEFDLNDPKGRVCITDIVHQAVFEIDELGGTGAAATGVVMGTKSAIIGKDVVINRPFFLFVADHTNRLILFTGRFCQPEN